MSGPDAFLIAKSIHMVTLIITISGFMLRGLWMMTGSPLLHAKPVRILPHVNDTVLLFSALWAGTLINQYPFVNAWLTAKVLGAIAYILLGAFALNYGRTKEIRITCLLMALVCFAYVVGVAVTRNPLIVI